MATHPSAFAVEKAPERILERYPFLACPTCICALQADDSVLVCPRCRNTFPVRAGTPIVLPSNVSFDTAVAHDVAQSEKGWARRVLTYGKHFGLHNHDRVLSLCAGGPVLNLGGGPTRDRPQYINLNLAPFPNVDIVGDAEHLPILGNALAGVVCNAVLEHVCAPWLVVQEIQRVLRPGGHVYIEVPFLQHFHPSPDDFYRFTLHGVRELCRDFEVLESGVVNGPMVTFVEMVESFIFLLPIRNRPIASLTKGIVRTALYPTRILDLILIRNERAHTVANGVYFLGRKTACAN